MFNIIFECGILTSLKEEVFAWVHGKKYIYGQKQTWRDLRDEPATVRQAAPICP